MKLSVFFDHVLEAAQQSGRSISDILKLCRKSGISGLETEYAWLKEHTDSADSALKTAGMEISSVYGFFDYGNHPDSSEGKRLLDMAAARNVSRVLIVPGTLPQPDAAELAACKKSYADTAAFMDRDPAVQNMRKALSELVDYARPLGIQITLEDFDGFLQPFSRPYELLWFMKNVTGLRYTLDTGNFAFSDEDVTAAAELLAPYIVHIHCKDRAPSSFVNGTYCKGLGACAVGDGYIPIDQLVRARIADGYDGYLAIEHFGASDQLQTILKSAVYLKKYL